MSTRQQGAQTPGRRVIAVETKEEWTAQNVRDNKQFAHPTKPLAKGTWALFDTACLSRSSYRQTDFVLIQPQKAVKDRIENKFKENGGWIRFPHNLLRVGVRVVQEYNPENGTKSWKVGDLAVCDKFYLDLATLPISIRARPVKLDITKGLETADEAYSIPSKCVEYGIERKKELNILKNDPILKAVPFDQDNPGNLTLFDDFYKAIGHDKKALRQLQANHKIIRYMYKTSETDSRSSGCRELILALNRGFINAGTRKLFKNNNFPSPKQLWKNNSKMRFTDPRDLYESGCVDDKMVIYALIFTWKEKGEDFWDSYYGRSISAIIRLVFHKAVIEGSKEIKSSFRLYERARDILSKKKGRWAWIPVIILPKGDKYLQDPGIALQCLEETMITMSGSYNDNFLQWSPDKHTSFWDVGLANRLNDIAKQVYAAHPEADYPLVRGCNVASPSMEPASDSSCSLWVRTTFYKEDGTPDMYVYTGKARPLTLNTTGDRMMCWLGSRGKPGGGQDRFDISWMPNEMEGVTSVIPHFEMKVDPDEAHPKAMIYVPEYGWCERYHEANRLAVRTDYVHGDDGLRSTYYHCRAPTYPYRNKLVNDDNDNNGKGKVKYYFEQQHQYMVGQWAYSMSWVLALLNTKLQTDDKSDTWPLKPYSAQIKCVETAFLFQAMVVTNMAKGAPQPAPRIRTNIDKSYYYLVDKFRERIPDMVIGDYNKALLKGGRFYCDTCYMSETFESAIDVGAHAKCERKRITLSSGIEAEVCECCERLCRVCTFTPSTILDKLFDSDVGGVRTLVYYKSPNLYDGLDNGRPISAAAKLAFDALGQVTETKRPETFDEDSS